MIPSYYKNKVICINNAQNHFSKELVIPFLINIENR